MECNNSDLKRLFMNDYATDSQVKQLADIAATHPVELLGALYEREISALSPLIAERCVSFITNAGQSEKLNAMDSKVVREILLKQLNTQT